MKYFLIAASLVVLGTMFLAGRALEVASDDGEPTATVPASVYPAGWIPNMCRAYGAVRAGPAHPEQVGVAVAQTALTFVPSWTPGDAARDELRRFFRLIDRYRDLEADTPGVGAGALREAEVALANAQAAAQQLQATVGETLPCDIPGAPALPLPARGSPRAPP